MEIIQSNIKLSVNHGGPIHYLGNRNLNLPDLSGHMHVDNSWLNEQFSIILANNKQQKFKRHFEPFAGSASWSLAAMELRLAEEYIINDSDTVLINTHCLIRNEPQKIKTTYTSLLKAYSNSSSKKDFFLKTISDYNTAEINQKSLLLPFIINHSWSGMIFHDDKGNIIYHEPTISGKTIAGYLETANLSLDLYLKEVDRVSALLNSNKVIFQSGDFQKTLSDIQQGDFVTLNPPYPENERSQSKKTGMYTELYSPETLHEKLINTIQQMEKRNVGYLMTYGFYNPNMKKFVIRNDSNQLKHFFRILGYKDCAFGMALDQMYLNSTFSIPKNLQSKIIKARDILENQDLTPEEALKKFIKLSNDKLYEEQIDNISN